MGLIEELQRRQGHKKQAEFSEELGISQSMLSQLYTGDRKIGRAVAKRIVQLYPDLRDDIAAFMLDEEDEPNDGTHAA